MFHVLFRLFLITAFVSPFIYYYLNPNVSCCTNDPTIIKRTINNNNENNSQKMNTNNKTFGQYELEYGETNTLVWKQNFNILRSKKVLKIFLDHGGFNFHGEIFFSVIVLMNKIFIQTNKEPTIIYYISKDFGYRSGLYKFWDRYANEYPLSNINFKFIDIKGYTRVNNICYQNREMSRTSFVNPNISTHFDLFDVRVTVTLPAASLTNNSKSCLSMYKNDPRNFFILHQYKRHGIMGTWNNVIMASDSLFITNKVTHHFTPHQMPINPVLPDCRMKPKMMVQGALTRRDIDELGMFCLLPRSGERDISIVVVSTESLPKNHACKNDSRVEERLSLGMLEFHEAFLGASFLAALIKKADTGDPMGYLDGHPSSNIAYAKHFNLRIIGHYKLSQAYVNALGPGKHHWHHGDMRSIKHTYEEAIQAFHEYCEVMDNIKSTKGKINSTVAWNTWIGYELEQFNSSFLNMAIF
jgi:hypothetical protein